MVKKWVSVFLCIALLVSPLVGLSGEAEREMVDMKGRHVLVPTEITRVVALAPADCEILYAIGGGDTLVGRGMDCNEPEGILEVPVVNSGMTTNLEQILALEPQVVLMNTMAQPLEQVQALEAAGIPVVATDTSDIEAVYESISLFGVLLHKEEEADRLTSSMREAFAELTEQGAGNAGKTVYFEVSPLQYGLWTAGDHTFLGELAALCGLTNIFKDLEGWAEVSQEQVIARNPDYIVTLFPGDGGESSSVDEIMGREGWDEITAVKNGAVMLGNVDELSRPGPRLVNAAQDLLAFTNQGE